MWEWGHLVLTVLHRSRWSNAVAGAIRCGYRMFDCAACYGSEDQIGEVFHAAFEEGVVERKDLFIHDKSME